MSTDAPQQPANRLATSSSPYLLQHKHNPVDWYPWGDEAIAAARQREVPIFLSIGYSTCYWCHVMERECFESKAIAEQMNAGFVCIKLDREERPDLDDLYMAATQMLTGHGGWPMSVFLDPTSLKPFWAGTYFPPVPARGMPSFPQVLQRMSDSWNNQRQSTLSQAQTVAAAVAERLAARSAPVVVGPEQVGMAVQTLLAIFDRTHGGFGNAPKFPQPVYLELMLAARARLTDQSHRTAVDAALTRTLDAMALGGIFDHVGGGFHRYSVDASWTVPHFEKMLYDNAQLLGVYAQAAADFNDPFYAHVAERIVEYVQREMTGPAGMFYTAQDAEVDGREGLSYLWTQEQFDTALPREDAAFAKAIYGLDAGKNFQDPHHPDAPAANVLRLSQRPDQADLHRLKRVNALLLYTRNHRKQPRLDDKIIRSWNGLMVASLARAGRLLGKGEWIDSANRVIEPGFASLFTAHGRFDSRVARQSGHTVTHTGSLLLEDLAAEAVALCELQRSQSGSSRANADAAVLAVSIAQELFADNEGAFHDTAAASDLFVRPRTTYDGAIPTGSSMMLHALIDLYELTGDTVHLKGAIDMLRSLSAAIHDSPIAAVNATRGLLRLLSSQPEAVQHAMADVSPVGVRVVAGENAPVVEVFASTAQVQIGRETPAEFYVRIVVPDGWHINDAFAGEASSGTIPPLVIGIAHGTGVQPYAEFPRGTPIQGSAHGVLAGEVVFPVVLERVGEWSGNPRLLLTYQACSDRACLEPATVELGVEIKPIDND